MRFAAPRLLLLLGISLLVPVGCGNDAGSLSGSLSEVYRLDYQRVRARLYTSELSIEYVAADEAVPVRVTVRLDELGELTAKEYDLGRYGDVSGRLSDGTEIPRFKDGTIDLDNFAPRPGAKVSGSFDANFDAGRDILSLSGDFDAQLEVISWPPRPDPEQVIDAGAALVDSSE